MNSKKVAALQMCSSNDVATNLKQAADLLQEAALQGASLVVLPEMFAILGQDPFEKLQVKEVFGSGLIQDFLSEQAKQYSMWIVGGTIPITCQSEGKVRAASLVFDHHGKVVARYDKIHLFDVDVSQHETYRESETTEPGDDIVLIDTPVGKLGLSVCYDIRFPELFRTLFNRGAEIIALPAAFTVTTGQAHWEVLARSRAIENQCYLIGATQGGKHPGGRETYGHALIVDPWGIAQVKPDCEPGIVYAQINQTYLLEKRKAIPVHTHQRLFVTR